MKNTLVARADRAFVPAGAPVSVVGGAAAGPLPRGVQVPSLASLLARAPHWDNVDAPDQNRAWWERSAVQTRRGYL